MFVQLPLLSPEVFTAFSLAIATPWLYRLFFVLRSTKDQILSSLLLIHTLYMLYYLLVSPEQNIFSVLDVPPSAPPDQLRDKLADRFNGLQNVPPYLATLVKKLGLMDLRLLYIRFGHNVLTSCTYCHSTDDYALYAFPTPLLEYLREIALVGILTLPETHTSFLRPLGLGVLLASLLTETYWTLTAQVSIPPFRSGVQTIMWHDTFVQLRHFLFLALPLVLHVLPYMGLHRIPIIGAFVPAPPPSSTPRRPMPTPSRGSANNHDSANGSTTTRQANVQNLTGSTHIPRDATLSQASSMTFETLGHLVPTLHLVKYVHAAVMRSQHLGGVSTSANGVDGGGQSDGHGVEGGDDEVGLGGRAKTNSKTNSKTESEESERELSDLHALASKWWAAEAREGRTIREDEEVRRILRGAGLGIDGAGGLMEGEGDADGPLLTNAKQAIELLKEQGARPSEHWLG